jgi:purine-cytosine permease-like protein
MLAVTLFLTSFSTFATLILGWLLGAMLVASLFLFRRHQIRVHDEHM